MNDTLKIIWGCLILFCVISIVVSVPVENTQSQIKRAILKKRLAPIARLDATQKYLDEYEKGSFDDVYMFGDSPRLKSLYSIELEKKLSDSESKQENSNIRKPLYIRDKNNPNILHKYPYYEKPQTSTRLGFSDIIKRFQKPPQFTTKPPYPQDKKTPQTYRPIYP